MSDGKRLTSAEIAERNMDVKRVYVTQHFSGPYNGGLAAVWASDYDALAAENAKLREQDEIHWKTRRTLLRDLEALQRAIQKTLDCIEYPHENDAVLALCRVEDILRPTLQPSEP